MKTYGTLFVILVTFAFGLLLATKDLNMSAVSTFKEVVTSKIEWVSQNVKNWRNIKLSVSQVEASEESIKNDELLIRQKRATTPFQDWAEQNSDRYWKKTGIGSNELFGFISNENCRSSEKYFLSCVNSVIYLLEDRGKNLSPITGQVEEFNSYSIEGRKRKFQAAVETEKQKISKYLQMFEKNTHLTVDFELIWKKIIENKYVPVRQSEQGVIASGINHFLSVYKDPHTYVLPEEYYNKVMSKLDRSSLFVGLILEKKPNGKTFVRKVYRFSDAEIAGVEENDEVLQINEIDLLNLTQSDLSRLLQSPAFNEFDFLVKRSGVVQKIKILRTFRVLSHAQFEVLRGIKNIAVATLSKFSHGACEQLAARIKSAVDKNIAGLVLDLRDNPGGQLDEANCVAGLFLGPNKTTHFVEYFDPLKEREVSVTSGAMLYSGPLAVLTNSFSASAAEVLAGALQDHRRAILVGERTFGKGSFQEPEVWRKNSLVTLFKTQGIYLLPSLRSPQIIGIEPDFFVDEGRIKLREENVYFNPLPQMTSQVFRRSPEKIAALEGGLKKCLDYLAVNTFRKTDVVLEKALKILSCPRVASQLGDFP